MFKKRREKYPSRSRMLVGTNSLVSKWRN